MFLLHYILPFVIFYFFRNKLILFGLLLGNLIDLDHVYYRIIRKVPWFKSACKKFGMQCSFNFYPLHNLTSAIVFLTLSLSIFIEEPIIKFFGWMAFGAFLNLTLDYIHLKIGFGI